jgi:NDP-sugar pyrophosphorylase family protein
LRPLSSVRAKPAVPVAGTPLISRILRYATRHGIQRAVVNLHHLPETITGLVGDGSDLNLEVKYSWEWPHVLGSAGGPRKALPLVGREDFFVINGDTLCDVDLTALAAQHADTGSLVTMAVIQNRWPDQYGGVVTDSQGRVYGFVPRGSPAAKYHFVGVQMVHPSVFADLPLDQPAESVRTVYPALIASKPGSVRAFLADAEFWDVGTPATYLEAALEIGGREGIPAPQIGAGTVVHQSARVTESVIWDRAEIGPDVTLERCIVADGVRVPAGRRFTNCVIIQGDGDLVASPMNHG